MPARGPISTPLTPMTMRDWSNSATARFSMWICILHRYAQSNVVIPHCRVLGYYPSSSRLRLLSPDHLCSMWRCFLLHIVECWVVTLQSHVCLRLLSLVPFILDVEVSPPSISPVRCDITHRRVLGRYPSHSHFSFEIIISYVVRSRCGYVSFIDRPCPMCCSHKSGFRSLSFSCSLENVVSLWAGSC